MVSVYLAVVALVVVSRLHELGVARRHTAWARARGGVEFGRGHFPFMVILHVAFLVGCVVEVVALERPFDAAVALPMFALLLAAQGVRMASMRALGPFWNTRVFVVPGAPVVTTGLYARLRHPNYVAVAIEGLALPLLHGAWLTALVFSALNAPLLALRIRCEERAIAAHACGADTLRGRPRFIPRRMEMESL